MAAPTPTARVNPADTSNQIDLHDGFSTTIVLDAGNDDLALWETVVPPPGYEGGDPIEITSMHNQTYRTFRPRALITLTPITVVGGYDPVLYTTFKTLINSDKTITVIFPDGSTIAFYGFTQSFIPQDHSEGERPLANVTVVPTNWDPVDRQEEDAVFTNVAGT